jgi:hypothetical protein
MLSHGSYSYVVLDPRLMLLAKTRRGDAGQARGRFVEDLDQVVRELTERARAEARRIMAFSEHERAVVESYCSPQVAGAFTELFCNAKRIIDRLARSRPSWKAQPRDLKTYCRLAGVGVPTPPSGGAAETLRRLSRAMDGRRRWTSLPKRYRDDGIALIDYNAADCRTLRRLSVKATNHLHAASAESHTPA